MTLDGNEQYADPGLLADALGPSGRRRRRADPRRPGLHRAPVSRRRTFDPETARRRATRRARARHHRRGRRDARRANPRARAPRLRRRLREGLQGRPASPPLPARIDATGRIFSVRRRPHEPPPRPLLQDLAVVSSLGLPHVERNGRHYFRGAGHLSADERSQLARRHPDLFTSVPTSASKRASSSWPHSIATASGRISSPLDRRVRGRRALKLKLPGSHRTARGDARSRGGARPRHPARRGPRGRARPARPAHRVGPRRASAPAASRCTRWSRGRHRGRPPAS